METCGHNEVGGVTTSFDPYGVREKLGLKGFPTKHFCWSCWDKFGKLLGEESEKEILIAIRKANWCGFREAWIGYCRNPKPCAKHNNIPCWKCGAPAIGNCSIASSLVCGFPYCKDHPHEESHY